MAGAHRSPDRTGWVTLSDHLAALHIEREKFQTERDRRYAEVSVEREKALKIKEVADLAALQLAREIQTYKDEKANQLREQIGSERGHYASKDDLANAVGKLDATLTPVLEFVSRQGGRSSGASALWGYIVGAVGVALALYAALR